MTEAIAEVWNNLKALQDRLQSELKKEDGEMDSFKISERGRNGHPVYVALESRDENTVQVVAVDKCGHRHRNGIIVIIGMDGVYRCRGLNECLGFTQDERQRILDLSWEGIR